MAHGFPCVVLVGAVAVTATLDWMMACMPAAVFYEAGG